MRWSTKKAVNCFLGLSKLSEEENDEIRFVKKCRAGNESCL